MSKKSKKSQKQQQSTPGSGKRKNKRRNPRRGIVMASDAVKWDRLLLDPCGAELTYPCYAGIDTGYLVRTTENQNVYCAGAGLIVGGKYIGQAYVQYTPSNKGYDGAGTDTSILTGSFAPGGVDPAVAGYATPTATIRSNQTFITNSAVVSRYRPVAACLKWVPTGPYSDRSGVVGLGSIAGGIIRFGLSYTQNNIQAAMGRISSNGSAHHEVRWLPTIEDEQFTTISDLNDFGAGAVIISLREIDGVAETPTILRLNGFLEITTVWEWVPNGAGGIAVSPKPPSAATSQQVLSTISDIGHYVYDGVRVAAGSRAGRDLLRTGAMAGVSLLSAGIRRQINRGPAIML